MAERKYTPAELKRWLECGDAKARQAAALIHVAPGRPAKADQR